MSLLTKNSTAYSKINPDKMILRDRLALDRTLLANERTVLAYARTSVALFILGITVIHFFSEESIFLLAGSFSIIFSLVTGLLGMNRYYKMREILNAIHRSESN